MNFGIIHLGSKYLISNPLISKAKTIRSKIRAVIRILYNRSIKIMYKTKTNNNITNEYCF